MWYRNENSGYARPSEVDTTSSKAYAYLRRNIEFVEERTRPDGEVEEAHYTWEETKIPKDVWDVCEKVLAHDGALDDVYSALTELAEMILEEEG